MAIDEIDIYNGDFSNLDPQLNLLKNNLRKKIYQIGEHTIERTLYTLLGSESYESFEIQTGFTIIGSELLGILANPNDFIAFRRDGIIHIRIYNSSTLSTIFIVLLSGDCVPLGVLPDFIGTVIIEHDKVINIIYKPCPGTSLFKKYELRNIEVMNRRALIAAATHHGIFELNGDTETIINAASYLRNEKALDPTLGLYAAYGYAHVGKMDQINSIYTYVSQGKAPNLFDLGMLSYFSATTENNNFNLMQLYDSFVSKKLYNNKNGFVPFCPVLTQGWSYLPAFDENLPKFYKTIALHLSPGLFTTFKSKVIEILTDYVEYNSF